MLSMKPNQKVNKIPGSGYVTNKVNLATTDLKHIPPAFRIPNDTQKLLKYAKNYPEKMFVQKNQNHRGIQIEKLEKLDLESPGSFVQEFVDDPFLSKFFFITKKISLKASYNLDSISKRNSSFNSRKNLF
jgi:tubulin monoglycylase TTLL15